MFVKIVLLNVVIVYILYVMKKIFIILLFPVLALCNYEYTLEDYNTTSPTYGLNVWNPEYLDYITLHYFSSQG